MAALLRDPRRLSAASVDVDACAHDMEAFGRLISGTQSGEAISGVHSNQVKATLRNQPALHARLGFTKGSTISYSRASS